MENVIYQLQFKNGVHFGNSSLDESEITLHADTLFSALYIEALKLEGEKSAEKLINAVLQGKLLISDMFPYNARSFFIPKPIKPLKIREESDSVRKKQFKKLKYIREERIGDYLKGSIDPQAELSILEDCGKGYIQSRVFNGNGSDPEPYHVGVFRFKDNAGLYFIAQIEDKELKEWFENIIESLSWTGIGGKKTSGLGQFFWKTTQISDSMQGRLNRADKADNKMLLSVALPKEDEIGKVIEGASMQIIKRSGFVDSLEYADEFRRKKDFYCMNSGSCFLDKFEGDIYNVSSGGRHAVYRYAKPFFMEVDA